MVNAITSGDILSAEQLKKHSKVYAGPGAGKTYFLVENVKNIITTNEFVAKSKARKVLCITYTNAAVDEIRRRLEKYVDYVEAYTIHGFIIEHIIKPFQIKYFLDALFYFHYSLLSFHYFYVYYVTFHYTL